MADHRVPVAVKRRVEERAAGCCEYCRSQAAYSVQSFSVEHIDPEGGAGGEALENLALACQGCNNAKYQKTQAPDPTTGEIVPLFHPRNQRWTDHFAWQDEYVIMVGLTPTGRATVEALRLNRSGVVNLRRLLVGVGKHPPASPPTASFSQREPDK
jgi:hypothetical protein